MIIGIPTTFLALCWNVLVCASYEPPVASIDLMGLLYCVLRETRQTDGWKDAWIKGWMDRQILEIDR